jgi:hypothetical protein
MARNSTRSTTTIADRRAKVGDLYLQGLNTYELARQFKVTPQTISNDITAIREAWMEKSITEFNNCKSEELAQIALIRREAWIAWNKSKKVAETVTEESEFVDQVEETNKDKTDQSDKPETVEAKKALEKIVKRTTKKEYRDGSAEYMRVLQWCVEQICAIRGLDSPKQIELSGMLKVDVKQSHTPNLTQDEIDALGELIVRSGLVGPAPLALAPGGAVDPGPNEDRTVVQAVPSAI